VNEEALAPCGAVGPPKKIKKENFIEKIAASFEKETKIPIIMIMTMMMMMIIIIIIIMKVNICYAYILAVF
jgi:hypothetical protein